MKRIFLPLVILLSTMSFMASCLGDDTEYATYYSDTAITAFSLGTLNRTVDTISSTGEDSSYTTTVTGSNYAFYIDQAQGLIYNNDSLPLGTDAEHVICSVSSKNSGLIVIKYIDSDTLDYYSSTDSIDFTSPREFRVYSTDGQSYRKYTVSVNVHQEAADSFNWSNPATISDFTNFTGMKAVALNDNLLLFGSNGSNTTIYATNIEDGSSWSEYTTNITLDADAYKNAVAFSDYVYTISNGSIYLTKDGTNWTEISDGTSYDGSGKVSQLIGGGSEYLYALNTDGGISISKDNGFTWAKDSIVANSPMLPVQNLGAGYFALKTNDDTERIIMTGLRNITEHPSDSVTMVWSKLEEYASGSNQHGWIYYDEVNGQQLPSLTNIQMIRYGDVLVAMGGTPLGTTTATAFSNIYTSEDNGISWQDNDSYVLPEGFTNNGSDVFAISTDKNKRLWIIYGGDGTVWRGRLNKLGWTTYQKSFTE
ncbi:MAG: DUF6242 domain-containing protein [Prevotellaceae bacterium]|nr:DUF6242 domain-containing protein [Prevotellaceae bacterium]